MSSIPTIGSGIIHFGSDFAGNVADATQLGPDLHAFGVGTETFGNITDESGGIFAMGTGGSTNDNHVLRAGPFAPRDGKMVVRSRFKLPTATTVAVYFGFAETLDITTPVMPAEFSGSAMTYNPGGLLGIQFDTAGTTDDFRAVMGDGSAAISDSSSGIRATATITADRWFTSKVILNEDGGGEVWFGHSGNANSVNFPKLTLVKRFSAGTLLTATDLFFACLMIEVRTGSARTLEVDHFAGEAGRDWRF